ncbi:MAG: Autolytic lysozyme [Firmicutes bacterium ADurb.Bin193]|nr:MAG: Autolytic lysozyme [Firmicutes bacterium ADurb.Bin193]
MRKIIRMLTAALTALALIAAPSAVFAAEYPIVKLGSTGPDAAAVQSLLNDHGFNLTVDGKIGSASVAAIRAFQSAAGITPDGIAGGATLERLTLTLRYGSRGRGVPALQYLLKQKWGFGVSIDGIFGYGTETAVKSFQSNAGIASDGIVGQTTWKNLFSSATPKPTPKPTDKPSQKASDIAIAKAKSLLGSTAYYGYCQRFVRISFEAAGIMGYASTANEAWSKWGVSTSSNNIPKGAIVYFNTSSSGHAGIYMGDGNVIHAVQTVKIESFEALKAKYGYKGWGYQGGVNPNL